MPQKYGPDMGMINKLGGKAMGEPCELASSSPGLMKTSVYLFRSAFQKRTLTMGEGLDRRRQAPTGKRSREGSGKSRDGLQGHRKRPFQKA